LAPGLLRTFTSPNFFALLLHLAGFEVRALLAAFENANLILQQRNLFLLLLHPLSQSLDHAQQRDHERRALGLRNRRHHKTVLHQCDTDLESSHLITCVSLSSQLIEKKILRIAPAY
jgi:hypothetical protein